MMRWWHFGLIGGFILSLATAVKVVRALFGGLAGETDRAQAIGFATPIFLTGFLCGVIVWAGRGMYHRIGMAGDALVGLAVMIAFFVACMLLFAPEMLGRKFSSAGGAPMLGLAAVIGLIGGAWIGRDLRKELAKQEHERQDGDDDDGFRTQ